MGAVVSYAQTKMPAFPVLQFFITLFKTTFCRKTAETKKIFKKIYDALVFFHNDFLRRISHPRSN